MIVVHGAAHPMAEEIYHEACRVCHQPWTDNSRSSKSCPKCRTAYKQAYDRKRRKRGTKPG